MDLARDAYRKTVHVHAWDGDVVATRSGFAPRWAPDGARLAVLDDDAGGVRLLVWDRRGGTSRDLGALDARGAPAWAPDGTWLAIAVAVAPDRRRIARVDATTGARRWLTSAHDDAADPAVAPDGDRLAFVRTPAGGAGAPAAELVVVDLADGTERRLAPELPYVLSPRWSPDGARLACYSSSEPFVGPEDPAMTVRAVDAAGAAPARRLAPGLDRGAIVARPPAASSGPCWVGSDRVAFAVGDRGRVRVVAAAAHGGDDLGVLVDGARMLGAFHAAAGRLAYVESRALSPSEVQLRGPDGTERGLRRLNAAVAPALARIEASHRAIALSDRTIDAWVLAPRERDGRLPLLVSAHGGPHAFVGEAMSPGHFYRHVLAARGWAVLVLNSSGSGSYGRAFARSIHGAWGERDLPEIEAAIDLLAAEGLVDPGRVAIAGYSYGGFLAAWAAAHSRRFKAAIVGGPVADLETFFETSDIGSWFVPWEMGAEPDEDRARYRRLSPVTHAARVTVPVLLQHGEADARCPVGQSEALLSALRAAGRDDAELVRYPDAGHDFPSSGRPTHRIEYNRRLIAWAERFARKGD